MKKEVEEIIQQGKDAIVQLALELVGGEASVDNFKEIKIMASSKEVYVSLLTPIKYLPINSAYYFDVEASLIQKSAVYHTHSNPAGYQDDKMNLPFYMETEEGRRNIQFVVEAINKNNPFDVSKFRDSMIIRDDIDFYSIKVESDYYDSWYKIDKKTGEIFDEGHAHFELSPTLENDQQEKLIEIK